MYKNIFTNNYLKDYLTNILTELNNDIKWNIVLRDIYNKSLKYISYLSDAEYDNWILYNITYKLRGNVIGPFKNKSYETNIITLLIYKSIIDNNIQDSDNIIIYCTNRDKIYDTYKENGIYWTYKIYTYKVKLENLLKFLNIKYKIVEKISDISDKEKSSSILYPLCSPFIGFDDFNVKEYHKVVQPIMYATTNNKDLIPVNNLLMNLMNTCFSDTITNKNKPYNNIKFNIAVL